MNEEKLKTIDWRERYIHGYETIVWYDMPIVWVSTFGDELRLWMEVTNSETVSNEDEYLYIAVPITREQINEIKALKLDLHEAFKSADCWRMLASNTELKSFDIIDSNNHHDDYLPDAGCFIYDG